MRYYNKLIRDKIPKIMEDVGKKFKTRIATDEEYDIMLKKKLLEECHEYYESGEVDELADILEVIISILNSKGLSYDDLETIRLKKMWERGSFTNRIVLEYTED